MDMVVSIVGLKLANYRNAYFLIKGFIHFLKDILIKWCITCIRL